MTAGDYDNDGVSEIVIYVPDADDPHLALYQIEDGAIQAQPEQTFSFPYELSINIYMASGDITGDNVDDLAVSYSPPGTDRFGEKNPAQVYVFKSQDSSLSNPHNFGTADSPAYSYDSGINNAALAIGDVIGNDGKNDLVMAASTLNTNIVGGVLDSVSVSVLSFEYDSTTEEISFSGLVKKIFDYKEINTPYLVIGGDGSYEPVTTRSLNTLTMLACVNDAVIYLNGFLVGYDDEVYHSHFTSHFNLMQFKSNVSVGDDEYTYFEYGTVAGNFDGNTEETGRGK